MATLIFSNSTSGNRSLYLPPSGKFWCAYLLPEGQRSSETSIPFDKTPLYKGFYLFASKAPSNIDAFVSSAQTYFTNTKKTYQAGGIAWFAEPDKTLSENNVQLIYLQAKDDGFTILCPFNYNFGNNFCTLTLTPYIDLKISIDAENNRFIIIGPPSPIFINLDVNNISSGIKPENKLIIPLTGDAIGSLRFTAGLHDELEFNAFDVAQKFFFTDSENKLQEISYPTFRNLSQNSLVYFQISIHPLDLLNKSAINTYLAFLGYSKLDPNDEKTFNTILGTNFRSDYGLPVNFIPFPDFSISDGTPNIPGDTCSLLVFSERAPSDPSYIWYTIPSGNFTLALNEGDYKFLNSQKQFRLLCGLSGTESISVTPQTKSIVGNKEILFPGDTVRFMGNQSAYAPHFPIINPINAVGSNTRQQWLTKDYLTAWAGIEKGQNSNSDIVYHSQPHGSSLFASNQGYNGQNNNFLEYFLSNSGMLSKAPNTIYFPLVAYGKNTTMAEHINASLYELQIINPTRKYIIASGLKNLRSGAKSDQLIASTTPQGFYIEEDSATSIWHKLLLASNQFTRSDGHLSDIFNLAFNDLDGKLQSAFQTNQLFLVISCNNNNVLGSFDHLIEIEEWPFDLNVPSKVKSGQYQNILIFKFCSQPLKERVQNIQYWTSPEDFNDTAENGLPNLSMWLNEYIQQGIDKYNNLHDPDFYKFYQVATDPDWKGVISLKVDISTDSFPPELQGLLAGIDMAKFNAHHFGIDLSVVHFDNGALSMKPTSSLFGLIDYEDPEFQIYNSNIETYKAEAPINTSVDYVYNVLLLKVLFQNSRILNFNSYIAFTINKLFGEKVKASDRTNLQILSGTYENHNDVPSYTFNAKGDSVLFLDSQVIQDVEILKSSFVTTVKGSNGSKGSGNVESQFSFFGYINFYELKGFDLLSFGSETGKPSSGQGISFSNLNIELTFPLDTPTTQIFTFDIKQISFDLGASYTREQSLYRHFPLQLHGMISGTSKDTPTSQGYMNVSLPALKQQQTISDDWYGLTFKLNMGTLGSLASSAGFNTTFLVPWNVGGHGATAGLKLPGVNPQAPALSLQGVLKLNIGSITLDIADDGVSYLMKINNIALKVLSLTFPSNATIGFYLFGNPSKDSQPESLGWYAAYKKT